MDKTYKLIAVKSFLGQPGESRRANGHVLPGDLLVTHKQRRQALLSRQLASDAPDAAPALPGKENPAPENKMAPGAGNKTIAPDGKGAMKGEAGSRKTGTGGKGDLPLEPGAAKPS